MSTLEPFVDQKDQAQKIDRQYLESKIPWIPLARSAGITDAKLVEGCKEFALKALEKGGDGLDVKKQYQVCLQNLVQHGFNKPEAQSQGQEAQAPPEGFQEREEGRGGEMVPYQASLVTPEMAKFVDEYGIPHPFLCVIGKGPRAELFVRKGGVLWKMEEKGPPQWIRTEIKQDPDHEDGYMAVAEMMPPITDKVIEAIKALKDLDKDVQKLLAERILQPFRAEGSARPDNVSRMIRGKFVREMAETRALLRMVRTYVACGFTSVEETEETEEERVEKAKKVTPREVPRIVEGVREMKGEKEAVG